MNTTDNDLFFQPVGNGTCGYISRFTNTSFGRSDIYRVTITSKPAQMAAVNQTLEKPVINTPSSEEVRSIVKINPESTTKKLQLTSNISEESSSDNQEPKSQTNESNDKLNNLSKTDSTLETSIDSNFEIQQVAVTKTTPSENKLSPGQKQAWHKMLYGGIGILAVFILFILFLLFKSRKRKKKLSEQKL
jgi:Fe2+ transport system protein B